MIDKKNISKFRIPLMKPILDKEMKKAIVNVLTKERFVLGESVYKFEEEFSKFCGVDYAVSMNSGTDALQIALISSGIRQGDNVITTPSSFIATSNAILHAYATPIFADIDVKTYSIDPIQIQKKLTGKVKAVIPVHLYGYPVDIESINDIVAKKDLYVIEDACQAHGALYKGKKVGSLGDVACFSFYPSKNMTVAGDGGMLVTNNEKLAIRSAKLRNCGRKNGEIHDIIGYTARLNTVNAAVGRIQLEHLNEWNEKRRKAAQIYDQLLSDIHEVIIPPKGDSTIQPVYHLYVIRTKFRDELKTWLELHGIQCGIHYRLPIHLQPIYKKLFGFKLGMYPKSEKLCTTCLSLPMFPKITKKEIEIVCEKIYDFFNQIKGKVRIARLS